MSKRTLARFGGLAALLAGVFWGFTLPLVATQATEDPVGLRYDDFNRWLTLPLALLVVALACVRALVAGRLPRGGRVGATVALVGSGLMLLGNVIEFWVVFLTDDYVTAIAEERNVNEWAGSTGGWLLFLVGVLLLFAGGVLVALAAWRARALPAWAGLVLAGTAPVLFGATGLWTSTVEGTIAVAAALGLAWIGFGLWLRARGTGTEEDVVVSSERRA